MSSQAQNMSTLYRDLFANSPKTVTMDLSADVGFGYISQVVTKRGAVFSDWHMKYNSDMVVHGPCSAEFIQIMFCMSEGVSWNVADVHSAVSITKGESYIYRGHGKTEYLCYRKDRDYQFKSVKIPISYFSELLPH